MPGRSAVRAGLVCVALLAVVPVAGRAAPIRRAFAPEDMEWEAPGVADLDMEFGVVRGEQAYRVSTPDFELDVGLLPNLELDLDGEMAVGGPDDGTFDFDHRAPDNLWASLKVGLLDVRETEADRVWTFGVQAGPELPLAIDNQGLGFEGLLLGGCLVHRTQLVANLGGLVDPGPGGGARPRGVEGGVSVDQPLDGAGRWTVSAALSGVRHLTDDRDQLTSTVGLAWSPTAMLDLGVTGLYGWLPGGDQWGLWLGISPKFRLW